MLPVILIKGPTASGKTALAMALADVFPVDLISVDSAQIYQDMDIGTAKPSREELAQYPHALIDILPPDQAFSASEFVAKANQLIAESYQQGRIPCLVGGTMMYFNALQNGLSELPSANAEIRHKLDALIAEKGLNFAWQELAGIDPPAAEKINPNDRQRIQRALEVYHISGKTMTELQQNKQPLVKHRYIKFAYFPTERQQLHKIIEQRFYTMIQQGLVEETEKLIDQYQLNETMPSLRSVGYRQVYDYLQGKSSKQEMLEKGIAATRQLAKRQMTWLRREKDLTLLQPYQPIKAQQQLLISQINKIMES